jgi:hypothetical protein
MTISDNGDDGNFQRIEFCGADRKFSMKAGEVYKIFEAKIFL